MSQLFIFRTVVELKLGTWLEHGETEKLRDSSETALEAERLEQLQLIWCLVRLG